MEKNKEFLGTEPIGKLLFKLAIPTVVAQLVNMLYNIVDRIYLGHMPVDGSLALISWLRNPYEGNKAEVAAEHFTEKRVIMTQRLIRCGTGE